MRPLFLLLILVACASLPGSQDTNASRLRSPEIRGTFGEGGWMPDSALKGAFLALRYSRSSERCRGPGTLTRTDRLGAFHFPSVAVDTTAADGGGSAREPVWLLCMAAPPQDSTGIWFPIYALPVGTSGTAVLGCQMHGSHGSPECVRRP